MKHTGGCHCGKIKFEVEINLDTAVSCNCSVCSKRGSLLGFAPETQFKLLQGENEQTEYLFNKKRIHHFFCKTCGILSFGKGQSPDGTKMIFVNVRCIDGIDISKIKIQEYNGKDM